MTLRTDSGLRLGDRRYMAQGESARFEGVVRPYVPGQKVTIEVREDGEVVERIQRRIKPAADRGGFRFGFEAERSGRYRVAAQHAQTPEQARFAASGPYLRSITPRARPGARGIEVAVLNDALRRLAYVAPDTKRYGHATRRAVTAFQKVNRMSRTGRAGRAVYVMLLEGQGGFRLAHPGAGRHVEFDWSRQVLVLANNRRPRRIYHSSSGKASTPTVRGRFRFYRKDRGTNAVGMVHSSYFHRGYAIHGYRSVPNYPASHGCLRVPIPDALSIFKWVRIGGPIYIYR